MKRLRLKFNSIADVADCAKTLDCGYIINTSALTLTGIFTQNILQQIEQRFIFTSSDVAEIIPLPPPSNYNYTAN